MKKEGPCGHAWARTRARKRRPSVARATDPNLPARKRRLPLSLSARVPALRSEVLSATQARSIKHIVSKKSGGVLRAPTLCFSRRSAQRCLRVVDSGLVGPVRCGVGRGALVDRDDLRAGVPVGIEAEGTHGAAVRANVGDRQADGLARLLYIG